MTSKKLPQVSVVVTCYNYGNYVADCLLSIQNQTFRDFEVIIIDDGSTDDSREKIQPFLLDSRFTLIVQSNQGQAKAKNRGIRESKGKYIAFLDADDQWQKTKLEKQCRKFSTDNIGVVYSRARYIDHSNNFVDLVLSGKYMRPRSGLVTNWLYLDNFIPFSSAIVRMKCFRDIGYFNESLPMGIDWDLWLRISIKYHFSYIDEPLLLYRIGHPGQMSKKQILRQECSDRIMQEFIEKYPNAVDAVVKKRAKLHTLCNRAEYYSTRMPWRGIMFALRAVGTAPFYARSYRGFFLVLRHLMGKRILQVF